MWDVRYTPGARDEEHALPKAEKAAMLNAVEKLRALGPRLPFPHQSDVRGAPGVRELRPRQGRSPWRAFYCRVGDMFVIAAIGPEAAVEPRGFARAVEAAQQRCATVSRQEGSETNVQSDTSG